MKMYKISVLYSVRTVLLVIKVLSEEEVFFLCETAT